MAIATLDDVIAALPGQRKTVIRPPQTSNNGMSAYGGGSLWRDTGGWPVAGAAHGDTDGAVCTSADAGAIPFTNPAGGNTMYLARFGAALSYSVTMRLVDRLWHNSGLDGNVATLQSFTAASLTRYSSAADCVGNEIWVEIYTAIGGTSKTLTVNYLDQDGNAGAGTCTLGGTGYGTVAGQMIPVGLASGDSGVTKIVSVQLNAGTGTAGNFGITLLHPISDLSVGYPQGYVERDLFAVGMPEVKSDACLSLMCISISTTTRASYGYYIDLSLIES